MSTPEELAEALNEMFKDNPDGLRQLIGETAKRETLARWHDMIDRIAADADHEDVTRRMVALGWTEQLVTELTGFANVVAADIPADDPRWIGEGDNRRLMFHMTGGEPVAVPYSELPDEIRLQIKREIGGMTPPTDRPGQYL